MKRVDLFSVGGDEVEVPADERGEFEAAVRERGVEARGVELWRVEGETVSVPEDERGEFLKAVEGRRSERVRVVQAGGESVEVPESERDEFMRFYRSDERFQGERRETLEGVRERMKGVVDRSVGGMGKYWEDLGRSQRNLLTQGYLAVPFTIAEKGLDTAGFVNRGLELMFGDLSGDDAKGRLKRGGIFAATGGVLPTVLLRGEALKGAKGKVEGVRERLLPAVGEDEDLGVRMAGQLMQSINESMAGGYAGRAVGAGRISLQTMLYAGSQATSTAEKAELKGMSKAAQFGLGAAAGAAEGSLETLSNVFGMQAIARRFVEGAVARSVMEKALNIVGEGVTEGLQSLSSAAIEKFSGIDDQTWREIAAAAALEAGMGLMSAGMMEGAELALTGFDAKFRGIEVDRGEMGPGMEQEQADGEPGSEKESGKQAEGERGPEVDPETGPLDDDTGVYEGEPSVEGEVDAETVEGFVRGSEGGIALRLRGAGEVEGETGEGRGAELVLAGVGLRRTADGGKVRAARFTGPDGVERWVYDRGLVDVADYYLRFGAPWEQRGRELSEGEQGVQAEAEGEQGAEGVQPEVEGEGEQKTRAEGREGAGSLFEVISEKVGFPVQPKKRVFVLLGKSVRPYKATVVDAVDADHVKIRVDGTQRSQKNRQVGFQTVPVKKMWEFSAVTSLRNYNEALKAVPKERRREVASDARRFKELMMGEPELVDQKALSVLAGTPGFATKRAGMMQAEMRKGYEMLEKMWGDEGLDLSNPVTRAENLGRLMELLEGYDMERSAAMDEPAGGRPEASELMSLRTVLREELGRLMRMPIDREGWSGDEVEAYRRQVRLIEREIAELDAVIGDVREDGAKQEDEGDIQDEGDEQGEMDDDLQPGDEGYMFVEEGPEAAEDGGTGRRRRRTVANVNIMGPESGGAGNEAHDGRSTVRTVGERLGAVAMDLRDAVQLYYEFARRFPKVRVMPKKLSSALGYYDPNTDDVVVAARVFGLVAQTDIYGMMAEAQEMGLEGAAAQEYVRAEVEELVKKRRDEPMKAPVKVLLHEVSHFIDRMPGKVKIKGNILAHVARLQGFFKNAMPGWPGGPEPLNKSDKARLWSRAERELERVFTEVSEEAQWREVPVTVEDLKAILRERAGKDTPALYEWFARQDDRVKAEVIRKAMKGIVDERAAQFGKREQTGVERKEVTRREKGTQEQVRRRYGELLRAEIERRQVIELEQFRAEARQVIEWWNGTERGIEYFTGKDQVGVREMFAQLFAIFLGDPVELEAQAPTVFRAFTGYMEVRPAVAKALQDFYVERHAGLSEGGHVRRLLEGWNARNDDQRAQLVRELNERNTFQNMMHLRVALDRITGPITMTVKRAAKLSGVDERTRVKMADIFAGIKDVLRMHNQVRAARIDVQGRVSNFLKEAGLDWWNLREYAFHNRVRFELDGRAAPGGWEPRTSGLRLESMRKEMGEQKFEALQQAWRNFREIYEKAALNGVGVRRMFGEKLHDLLLENIYYVTFQHVPSAEEVEMTREERRKLKKEKGAAAVEAFDLMHAELGKRAGNATEKIYELKGSFDPIADPLATTLQKMAKIIRAGYVNDLKLQVVEFLLERDYPGVRKAKRGKDGKLESVDDGTRKTLYYMDGGVLQGVVVSKWLEQSLNFQNAGERFSLLNDFMRVNRTMSALYTTLNYAFMEPNFERDKQSAVANVKGLYRHPIASVPFIRGTTLAALFTRYLPETVMRRLPKWLWPDNTIEYYEAVARRVAILIEKGDFEARLKEAERLEAEGREREGDRIRSDVAWARAALGSNILMTMPQSVRPGSGYSQYDRDNARYGLKLDAEATGFLGKIKGVFESLADGYMRLGEIRENTTKLASFMFLKQKGYSESEIKTIVAEFGGSPDFSEYGEYKQMGEFFGGAFLNASKEGHARGIKAALDHPGDYVLKKMMYTVGPTAQRWMVASGLLLAAMRSIWDEDELKEMWAYHWLRWMRNKYSMVGDYFMKNYQTFVLPVDAGEDFAVVLTIPFDQGESVWAGLTVAALDAMAARAGVDTAKTTMSAWEQSIYPIFGEFGPGKGGPLINAILPMLKTLGGQHHFDSFRQQNVLTDDELAQRWSAPQYALEQLAGHAWNAAGGGVIKRHRREKPSVGMSAKQAAKYVATGEKPFDRPEEHLNLMAAETFLDLPIVQPAIGRWIRVVRSGRNQEMAVVERPVAARKEQARLRAREVFMQSVKADKMYGPLYWAEARKDAYFKDYYEHLVTEFVRDKTANRAIQDAIRRADTPEQFRRVYKKIQSYEMRE